MISQIFNTKLKMIPVKRQPHNNSQNNDDVVVKLQNALQQCHCQNIKLCQQVLILLEENQKLKSVKDNQKNSKGTLNNEILERTQKPNGQSSIASAKGRTRSRTITKDPYIRQDNYPVNNHRMTTKSLKVPKMKAKINEMLLSKTIYEEISQEESRETNSDKQNNQRQEQVQCPLVDNISSQASLNNEKKINKISESENQKQEKLIKQSETAEKRMIKDVYLQNETLNSDQFTFEKVPVFVSEPCSFPKMECQDKKDSITSQREEQIQKLSQDILRLQQSRRKTKKYSLGLGEEQLDRIWKQKQFFLEKQRSKSKDYSKLKEIINSKDRKSKNTKRQNFQHVSFLQICKPAYEKKQQFIQQKENQSIKNLDFTNKSQQVYLVSDFKLAEPKNKICMSPKASRSVSKKLYFHCSPNNDKQLKKPSFFLNPNILR